MRNALDLVSGLSATECLNVLQNKPEDQWFDRKSARIHPRALAETLVAMANAEGGCVVIGLADGEVSDATANPGVVNGWRQAGIDYAQPPVATAFSTVDWEDDRGRKGDLVVIEVAPSAQVHATSKDEVFLRVGDENRRLSFLQRQDLLYDKGQAQYDGLATHDWPTEELDWDAIRGYVRHIKATSVESVVAARGLKTRDGKVTVAGMLLFGRQPQVWFPSAHLRVVRYRGSERGTGARLQVIDDQRVEGSIPEQIREAAKQVQELVPARQALKRDGLFGPVALIPRDAWLEGIVNAAIHRSYSNFGDHTRIEIFNDRIEIESPGRFPGVVDLTDPRAVTRFARNPHVARVCAELGLGREFGEGIKRMFEEMRLAGLADPEYRQTSGSVRLTLPTDPVERELEERLPEDARKVARLLREGGGLGTGDLVEATGRSRPWVLAQLRSLEQAGVVERVGKTANDPRAYWRLRID